MVRARVLDRARVLRGGELGAISRAAPRLPRGRPSAGRRLLFPLRSPEPARAYFGPNFLSEP